MRAVPILVITLAMAGYAAADTLPSGGGLLHGTILGLRDGEIEIQNDRQVISRVPPNCAGAISVAALPKFEEAERAFLDRQYKGAITLYNQALRNVEDPAMQALLQARLVRALDSDGQLTEATRVFLDLYAAQPLDTIAVLHPENLPSAGSKALGQSAQLVEHALHDGKLTAAQAKPLKLFLLDLYLKANDDRSAALAHELEGTTARALAGTTDVSNGNSATAPDEFAKARAELAAGHAAEVEKMVAADLENKNPSVAAQAALLEGQAMQAQGKFDDACLCYLTVAAKVPGDRLAATALLAAARVQKDNRHEPQEAIRLAQRIMQDYPQSPEALEARRMTP